MNSTETSSDPSSSSTEHEDLQARINDRDSRNAEEVSLLDIAGVVANLNDKICHLRREILELRDCGTISVVRKSVEIENGNPSGSPLKDQRTVKNLGISFMRKIIPLTFFGRSISRRNESKESINESNLSIFSNHYGCTPSEEDLSFNSETQSGRRLVYVVGAQAKWRSASPFKQEKDFKIRKQLPVKESPEAESEDAELVNRGQTKKFNEPKKINKVRKKGNAGQKIRSNGSEINDDNGNNNDNNDNHDNGGDETIKPSENCLSGEVECVKRKREGRRMGKWRKSKPVEPTKLNQCLNTNCYGKRVRKRISRGVQTAPKKRCRIVNLLRKFRWRSRKKRRKEKVLTVGETPSKKGSVDMIYEPSGTSGRSDNTSLNIESNDVTSETNDERKDKRKQRNSDSRARNYNRKYDLSIDGTKVETIRTEKNNHVTKRENRKPLRNTTETEKKVDSKEEGKRRRKIKRKERNLSSSDVGTSDRISEPRTEQPNPRESVQKTDPSDKTEIIREESKSRKMNKEDKGTRSEREKIEKRDTNAAEKPAATKRRTKCSKNRKKTSTFKTFTDSVRNSFTQQRTSLDNKNQEIRNEFISEQLDARKNDIADVKRRLDGCIDDLNDIIFNLSELFREAPISGGPAGEGTESQNRNFPHQGRSRFR